MARRSQCSSAGDNPLDPNYLPPHYREEYRLAVDALVEEDLEGYYQFLQKADVVDFLSLPEIQYIQESVQVPEQSDYPDQRFLELGEDGSSDTYWPILSDLDAPGLDLGWPQLHHFIGPTEVTTLVNPPEPDMPSIKDQARRLIKNAQQVIAIVMDMFTDVDILADILNAAMRNVAVYILLDKENVHHFVNMVSNCRVNLQSIQFLRVRTVSGITYHCRSGKSFKGQMMDRFLLTDCRAVLSGNYSFMWSFEKLHRCMAHLFLGQLVSTFDEEFRILFAQSQPLIIENVPGPMDDFSLAQKRQYPIERPSLYREQRKFLSLDTAHPDDWARHSYDEPTEVDWRMMPLKKQESLHGPADMYGRFPSQQSRMDPCFDQGPSRMQMMDNPAFKRHSYAEGIHGRYSYPFLQQGMPEPDSQGRQFHRGPQPYPGPEADYGGYEKFWNQDFQSADQCSEPCLPPDMEPPDNFDPVLKYLSSTRNVDIDQGPNRLPPPADLPFSSSHPKRLTLGQPYTYETSPTPSNPTDQKQFFQEPNTNRKDPMVKQGLRNWRISSYLSAYDNPGDEGLPLAPPNASDPFEEPSNPTQQTAPGIDLSTPKIPNVREFKVPAIPRASQMPSYAKTTAREQPRKLPDEPTAVAPETTTTPACSELSSTNEREKTDEAEQKEPKPATIQREESFRRKYNAAVQRSSRLRSSLIFSSLEQQHPSHDTKTAPGQEDGESDKNEAEQTKLPFVSQVLGQRRSSAKDPVEWSRYIRSATFDSSATGSSKPDDGSTKADDKDPLKDKNPQDLPGNPEVQESSKPQNIEQGNSSPSISRSKPSEVELPKTNQPVQPPTSLFTTPFVDMSDPDNRLMFFKELAAKRRAAKAEEAEKSKEMIKPTTELQTNTTVKKEKSEPGEKEADTSTSKGLSEKSATTEDVGKTVSTEACHSVSQPLDASDKTIKEDSEVKDDFNTSQSCKKEQTRLSADSRKIQLKNIQTATTLHISEEEEAPQSKPPEEPKLSNLAVKKSSSCHPPTPTSATPANVPSLAQGTDKSESPCLDSTSKESRSLPPTSGEVSPTFANASLDSIIQNPEPVKLETPLLSEQHSESEYSSSNPAVQSSSDHILPESGSPSRSAPVQTIFSNENSSSSLTSSILSPKTEPQRPQSTEKKISPSAPDPPKKPTSPLASNPSQKPTSPIASNPSQSAEKTISPSAPAACQKPASHSASEPSQSTEKKISPSAPEPSQKPTRPSVSNPSQSAEKTVRPSTLDLSQKSTSPSTPEPSQLVEETSQKSTARRISQTESTQTHLDSVSQVMSPKTGSSVHSTRVVSDVSPDTCAADTSSSQPITATDFGESGALEKYVSESENYSVPANGEECEVIESSKDVKPDGITSSPSSSSAGSCLPKESALESKSRSDDNKTISPTLSPVDCPPKHSPAEISIPVQPDLSPNASQLGTTASSPDVPVLTTTPSELNLSGSVTPAAAETVSRSSPLTETSGSVLFPEAEKTLSDLHSLPDTNSPLKQITAVSNKDSKLQSAETCSPNEPTSKFPTEPDLPCKTSQSVTSETHPSDPLVPAEGTNMDSPNNTSKEPEMPESDEKKKTDDTEATNKVNETTPQGSTCSEKTSDQVRQNNCSDLPEITSDGAIPPSQSKLPKSSQSRYHSSTANVLSSSNLRDDTKLLLEQISANSQSRSEASKESPVTDDEKEDEADKHAKRDTERETNESPATDDEKEDKADKKARGVKEGEIRSLGRVQPKSTGQERDKLLERIQSMRKERKVYSRFERKRYRTIKPGVQITCATTNKGLLTVGESPVRFKCEI